jgi:hypothetical protein
MESDLATAAETVQTANAQIVSQAATIAANQSALAADAAAIASKDAALTANAALIAADQITISDLQAQLAAVPPPSTVRKMLLGLYGATNTEAGMTAADAAAGVQIPLSRLYYGLSQTALADALAQETKGRTLLMSFAPRDSASPTNWHTFADIAAGVYDADVDRTGALLATFKRKHYVGFAHEPETLIAQHGSGTLTQYVAAWEHVIGRWKAKGANHIWTPCFQAKVPAGALPPTKDRIGCDPYNWFNVAGHMGPWVWPETLLDNAIASAVAAGDSTTPMVICETGVGPDPRKGAWIARLYLGALARTRIDAVSYFSTNKETDWRVDSDVDSLGAWQAAMKASVTPGV